MNTLKIINTNDNVEMVIVQLLEYNRLKQENIDLHNKLNLLTNESTKLNADLLAKNLELEILRKENQELREKIKMLEEKILNQDKNINELKENIANKDIRIDVLEKDNKILKEDNKILKEDNKILKNRINVLETNKNIFDALVKLHECNALVNKEFKRLYKKKFNLSKYDNNVPNIGDFIDNPPTKEDGDDYDFWVEFNELYPGSNNESFRKIYKQIANNRADAGAHISVNKLNEYDTDELKIHRIAKGYRALPVEPCCDFDKLIEIVYPIEYNENKKIYNEYRDWLFMFPA